MLTGITINNLALIRELHIDFSQNFNVFSGETGAGKSIIVDSLMLLIGARYDKTMLSYGEDKGFVEGVFTCDDVKPLEELGIDAEDGMLIVTRRFFKDGRNDIRVNGKQVTTAMLRELMSSYVDIYGQNEYQSLLKVNEQRKILDYFVFKNAPELLEKHKALYDEYKKLRAEMAELGDEQQRAQRIDILKFQIDEIENAAVEKDEEQSLIGRRHVLMSAERIKSALADCMNTLDSDGGALSSIIGAARDLSSVSSFGSNYASLHDRLRSVSIELDDIVSCIKDELDGMDSGERELDEVVARLDKIRALKSKYGSFDAMNKFLQSSKSELEKLQNGEELYAELCKKEGSLRKKLFDSCKMLSEMRRNGAEELSKKIIDELADLGMAKSRFETKFNDMPEIDGFIEKVTATGFDEFEFYLSPNAGQPLLPLLKIISGGEMSRFMLAIKMITGNLGNLDTMIFDEVDTGISGAVGLSVAKKLCELSRNRQVLCVTHLPQIAAMADTHFYIQKYDEGGNTVTSVEVLERSGQIGEIARLSGSKGVSATSDKNAEELKAWSDEFKRGILKKK